MVSKATFGLSKRWEEANHRQQVARVLLMFVKDALQYMSKYPPTKSYVPDVALRRSPLRLQVLIADPDQRQAIADAIIGFPLPGDATLESASCAQLPFNDPPLKLDT